MGIVYYALLGIIPAVLMGVLFGSIALLIRKSPKFHKWWFGMVDDYHKKPEGFRTMVKILFYGFFLFVGYQILKYMIG